MTGAACLICETPWMLIGSGLRGSRSLSFAKGRACVDDRRANIAERETVVLCVEPFGAPCHLHGLENNPPRTVNLQRVVDDRANRVIVQTAFAHGQQRDGNPDR